MESGREILFKFLHDSKAFSWIWVTWDGIKISSILLWANDHSPIIWSSEFSKKIILLRFDLKNIYGAISLTNGGILTRYGTA